MSRHSQGLTSQAAVIPEVVRVVDIVHCEAPGPRRDGGLGLKPPSLSVATRFFFSTGPWRDGGPGPATLGEMEGAGPS